MGTDVYLEWKGKTEQDKKKQCTGFDCASGDVGYLRASIGMVRENHLLRVLFPDCWDGHNRDRYDFKDSYEKMLSLGLPYFLNCLTGKTPEISEQQQSQVKMGEAVLEALKRAGFGAGQIDQSENNDGHFLDEFRFGITWFDSLCKFFELGIQKQEKGKQPYVYMSW